MNSNAAPRPLAHASIEPLCEATPWSDLMLLAAWDGLSTESHIAILAAYGGGRKVIPRRIADRALQSRNGYVRYLVASRLASADQQELRNVLAADEEPLVRSVVAPSFALERFDSEIVVDRFLGEPYEFRLSAMQSRALTVDNVVTCIRRALQTGALPESQLSAMLDQYVQALRRDGVWSHEVFDGGDDYRRACEFEALWRLIRDVPQPLKEVLVRGLPTQAAGALCEVPKEVIRSLPPALLARLLERDDVELRDIRRDLALNHTPNGDYDFTVEAAVSHSFSLTADEFARLLRSDRRRLHAMTFARDLKPVMLEAARQAMEDDDDELEQAYLFEAQLRQSLQRATSVDRWRSILEIRLFHLARNLASRSENDSSYWSHSDKSRLKPLVIAGDAWATYQNLVGRFPSDREHAWPTFLSAHVPAAEDIESLSDHDEGSSPTDGVSASRKLEDDLEAIKCQLTRVERLLRGTRDTDAAHGGPRPLLARLGISIR